MTSHNLEKKTTCFNFPSLQEAIPTKGKAVVVIAEIQNIKAVELPFEELQRAEEITHEASMDRYLAGRYLLRGILSPWLGIKPRKIPILLSPSGKPYLSDQQYQFSISHTGQVVGAVFSTMSPGIDSMSAGIDLEQEHEVDVLALARRFFSPEESAFLEKSHSAQADFFQLWCCREAAIKADGRGLGQLLAVTSISPDEMRGDCIPVRIGSVQWNSYPWRLQDEIHGAVAFLEEPSVIHWCDLREPLG